MTIYVGRWDLLPEGWEGINGLYEKTEKEIHMEVMREFVLANDKPWGSGIDPLIGTYTAAQFEETFNGDQLGRFNGLNYWIKIFTDGKSVLSK